MKATYIEHSSGVRSAIGVLIVNDTPTPQKRLEETLFSGSPFRVPDAPMPRLASVSDALPVQE